MAIVYQSDAVVAGIMPDHSLAGVVLCRTIEFTPGTELAIADSVQMCPVFDNMKILGIDLSYQAFGASRTLNIGDGGNADRFFAALDVAAAAAKTMLADGDHVEGFNYEYTGEDTIDIVLAGGVWPITVTLKMNVYYKMTGVIGDEG
ncbi:MAG: hypothetical protein JRG81_00140 [Deltaproteobacteria bacterium]|nr:hypothetical protein [Deltaproteobacteria bacterium]MBW2363486.1 hypothetical protein [Deltaproteobacteria bacterium]